MYSPISFLHIFALAYITFLLKPLIRTQKTLVRLSAKVSNCQEYVKFMPKSRMPRFLSAAIHPASQPTYLIHLCHKRKFETRLNQPAKQSKQGRQKDSPSTEESPTLGKILNMLCVAQLLLRERFAISLRRYICALEWVGRQLGKQYNTSIIILYWVWAGYPLNLLCRRRETPNARYYGILDIGTYVQIANFILSFQHEANQSSFAHNLRSIMKYILKECLEDILQRHKVMKDNELIPQFYELISPWSSDIVSSIDTITIAIFHTFASVFQVQLPAIKHVRQRRGIFFCPVSI